jgi:hypothetical protein
MVVYLHILLPDMYAILKYKKAYAHGPYTNKSVRFWPHPHLAWASYGAIPGLALVLQGDILHR